MGPHLRRFCARLAEKGPWLLTRDLVRGRLYGAWLGYLENRFDRRHRTDTGGRIPPQALALSEPQASDANHYQATPDTTFRRAMRWLRIDFADFVFVDVGSGKGRVVLLASHLPFKRIVGVEFSRTLHDVAVRNVATYANRRRRCPDLDLLNLDILTYDLPDGNAIYFLNNPFNEETLKAFVRRLEEQISRTRAVMYVVYLNPKHARILDDSQSFRLVAYDEFFCRGSQGNRGRVAIYRAERSEALRVRGEWSV